MHDYAAVCYFLTCPFPLLTMCIIKKMQDQSRGAAPYSSSGSGPHSNLYVRNLGEEASGVLRSCTPEKNEGLVLYLHARFTAEPSAIGALTMQVLAGE